MRDNIRNSIVRSILVMGVAISIVGCSISAESLVGEWRVRPSSLDRLPPELQQAKGVLTLVGDGTFRAEGLPIRSIAPNMTLEPQYAIFTGSGDWSVDRTSGQVIRLLYKQSTNEADSPHLPYADSLGVVWGFEWLLAYYLSDPDSDDTLFFEKVESGGN